MLIQQYRTNSNAFEELLKEANSYVQSLLCCHIIKIMYSFLCTLLIIMTTILITSVAVNRMRLTHTNIFENSSILNLFCSKQFNIFYSHITTNNTKCRTQIKEGNIHDFSCVSCPKPFTHSSHFINSKYFMQNILKIQYKAMYKTQRDMQLYNYGGSTTEISEEKIILGTNLW